MNKVSTEKIVDSLLEGKELSTLLTNPNKVNLMGKTISNSVCPSCQEKGTLKVTSVLDEDQGFYTVVVKCENCGDPAELELVLKEGTYLSLEDGELVYEGREFMLCNEAGFRNGNYLKFSNGVRGFIIENDKKEKLITFDAPEDEELVPLNVRVTYKVISFRNGQAKLISMVNDNLGRFPAGTLFYVDKEKLKKYAKISQRRDAPN